MDIEFDAWMERGLCRQVVDADAFFPDSGIVTKSVAQICKACDVKAECLAYALANDERYGVWGGASEKDRRRMGQVHVERWRKFSAAEDDELRRLAADGMSNVRIAAALGRAVSAIRFRRNALGVPASTQTGGAR